MNSFPEARLGAASDLHRIPLSTLSQPAFQGLAAALHNSATSDPDPKVKTAANRKHRSAQRWVFLGHWKGSGSTISTLSVDRKPEGIQMRDYLPCPSGDCDFSPATLIESYSLTSAASVCRYFPRTDAHLVPSGPRRGFRAVDRRAPCSGHRRRDPPEFVRWVEDNSPPGMCSRACSTARKKRSSTDRIPPPTSY